MTLSPEKNPSPVFPEDLLENAEALPADSVCWRIAHVKSRREKALAGYLADRGIGYFLPMVRRRQSSAKRVSGLFVFQGR
ncbi:MAG: hypothetical protein ACOC1H_00540 [Desulfosalsimonas sp.]